MNSLFGERGLFCQGLVVRPLRRGREWRDEEGKPPSGCTPGSRAGAVGARALAESLALPRTSGVTQVRVILSQHFLTCKTELVRDFFTRLP